MSNRSAALLTKSMETKPQPSKPQTPPPTREEPIFASVMGVKPQTPVNQPKTEAIQPQNPTIPQVHKPTTPHVGKMAAIQTALSDKANDYATFRCPPDVMDKADEIMLILKRRYKLKVHNYELFTAALVSLMWDIEHEETESDVIKLLKEKGDL